MATIKKVAQNTTLYFMSSLILRASSIIFFPIFSFYLTKEDYGILFVTQSVTAVLISFSALEIHRAVTRFIYDEKIQSTPEKIFATGIWMSLFSNILWVCVLLMFGESLLRPVLNDIDFFPYMFYSGLAIVFSSIVDNYRAFLKARHKGKSSFTFELSYYGLIIALNLLLVAVFKMDVIGLIYSVLISGIGFSIYIIFKTRHSFFKRLDFQLAKKMLSFSFPLIPFTLLGLLLTTTDRFLLNSYIGKEASGIYYIAFTLGALYSTFKEAIYASFTPWFYQHFSKEKYDDIKRIFSFLIGGSAIICLLISLFSFEVLKVISSKEEFVEGWKYVPFITTGFLIVFTGQLISLPIFQSKKTRYFFLSNLGGFLVLAGLGYLLIKDYGLYGVLSAKMIAFTVMVVIQFYLAISVSDFRVNVIKSVLVIAFTFALSFLHYLNIEYFSLLIIKITLMVGLIYVFYVRLKSNYFPENNLFGIIGRLLKA